MPGRRGLDDLIERSEPPGVEFLLDFVSGGQLTDGVGADVAHLDLPGPQSRRARSVIGPPSDADRASAAARRALILDSPARASTFDTPPWDTRQAPDAPPVGAWGAG